LLARQSRSLARQSRSLANVNVHSNLIILSEAIARNNNKIISMTLLSLPLHLMLSLSHLSHLIRISVRQPRSSYLSTVTVISLSSIIILLSPLLNLGLHLHSSYHFISLQSLPVSTSSQHYNTLSSSLISSSSLQPSLSLHIFIKLL
jgi:hypothetical protein